MRTAPPEQVPVVSGPPAVPSALVTAVPSAASPESTYGRTFLKLSEPAGYFPSENVVSNETSYLHVLDAMRRLGVKGGAPGVGAQGATMADVLARMPNARGRVLPNVSRAILANGGGKSDIAPASQRS